MNQCQRQRITLLVILNDNMWLELWGHLAAIFAWGGEGGGGGGGGDFEVGGIGICTVGPITMP